MAIIIKISDTVTDEQKLDLRFQTLLSESEAFWNDPIRCTDHFKLMLGLHEAGHAYFARRSGAKNIRFYGATMHWDTRPQFDCPAISRSSISWTPAVGGPVVHNVKPHIGGFICRRELSGSFNDKIAIEKDLQGCREWFDQNVGKGDDVFKAALQDAEREILKDLRSPAVRREIWDEARRFVREVFGEEKSNESNLGNSETVN